MSARNSGFVKKTCAFIIIIGFALSIRCNGQGMNHPFYDFSRTIHFGLMFGTNYSSFKYDYAPEWYTQDSFAAVNSIGYPGITLGLPVINWHVGPKKSYIREHLDVRAVIPTIVLNTRRMKYTHTNSREELKEIEVAMLEAPIMIKFKSDRFQNVRFYTIGGVKFSYDLSSDAKASRNPFDPKVTVYPVNVFYEYGVGLDMYFPFFKFSPEVKLSKGINNVLVPDPAAYSNVFSRFRSNFIFFSLYFEG